MINFFIILVFIILFVFLDSLTSSVSDSDFIPKKIYKKIVTRKIDKVIKTNSFIYPTFYDSNLKHKTLNELKCLNLKVTKDNINYVSINMILDELFYRYNKAVECLNYLNISNYEKYSIDTISIVKNEFKQDSKIRKILLENLKELLSIVKNCYSIAEAQTNKNKIYEENLIALCECTKDFILFFHKTTNIQNLEDRISNFKNKMEMQINYLD
ncbi:hypothetical protein [Clostridium perfringens]|uniref:hypothetical protein n=1 Tax=Clostridium perfringens TaxID=1502 RepID=UPI0024BBF117|nr:hypothetical protein [Clostridium perfringens]